MARFAHALAAASLLISSGAALAASQGDVLVVGHAGSDGQMIERVVSYDAKAGRNALMSRLSLAIESLCDESVSATTDPVGNLKCTNSAWAQAKEQLAGNRLASR